MTFKQFIARHRITATADWRDRNPNMTGADGSMPAGSTHWAVTLRYQRRRMTIPFSQGPAHSSEPSAADVLSCLASDAGSISTSASFDGWCADLGYSTDSRRAERTYNAVMRQTEQLRRFLGDAFDELQRCEE